MPTNDLPLRTAATPTVAAPANGSRTTPAGGQMYRIHHSHSLSGVPAGWPAAAELVTLSVLDSGIRLKGVEPPRSTAACLARPLRMAWPLGGLRRQRSSRRSASVRTEGSTERRQWTAGIAAWFHQ
jgi:hypothetical protein